MKTALLVALALSAAFSGCSKSSGAAPVEFSAEFSVAPHEPGSATYVFDASASTGTIRSYRWNFGDGDFDETTGPRVVHTYRLDNVLFFVSLTAVGAGGELDQFYDSVSLGTGRNFDPDAIVHNESRWVKPGEWVRMDASASSDHDFDPITMEWFFGAYPAALPSAARFDTGYLDLDESRNLTLPMPGVYLLHCHPHPWMRARLTVSELASADAPTSLDLRDFAFGPANLTVRPNTTIRITNRDRTQHTATTEFFLPGATLGANPVFNQTLTSEGDYQAWLLVTEAKGGRTLQSFGLRASPDAPSVAPVSASGPAATEHDPDDEMTTALPRLDWPTDTNLQLTYQSASPFGMNLSLSERDHTTSIDAECESTGVCTIQTVLAPGNYTAHYRVQTGAVASWSLAGTFVPWAKPGFGDAYYSSAHHTHPGAPAPTPT